MTTTSNITTAPADLASAIRLMKQTVRQQIGDITALMEALTTSLQQEIQELQQLQAEGHNPWPVLQFTDIANNRVSAQDIALIKKRGCLVVKGHFPHGKVQAWDDSIVDYLEQNAFMQHYRGPGDQFFSSLEASKPEIYPIYWSQAQMEARQHDNMARVQSCLNRLWHFESAGKCWFDPDSSIIYPDRLRRRPPGSDSKGLGAHTDSGALERWLLPAYQQVFRHVFNGSLSQYDPWDAAYRTDVNEYSVEGTTKCSVFRTFQGWTALSDMLPGQGLLHVLPIPRAMLYILLRPLLADVPEEALCGVAPGKVLPVNQQWHSLLLEGLCSIPAIEAGDSVWWHCDMVHSVAPVEQQQGWGNVMYIPAAPLCDKNLHYAHTVAQALAEGHSPADFPPEHYEAHWQGRFTPAQLNAIGRRGLGMGS
ncbi:MAG: DUF1479 domain-containing protein [Enterobacteriaceae bacterium]